MRPAERLARDLLIETRRDYILLWQFTRVRRLFPVADAEERREIALEAVRWLMDNGYVLAGEQHRDGSFEQWDMTTDEIINYVDDLWRREDGDLKPYHFPYFSGTESGEELGRRWFLERPELLDDEFSNILFADRHDSGQEHLRISDLWEACRRHNPSAPIEELRRAVLREVRTLVGGDYVRLVDRARSRISKGPELDDYMKRIATALPETADAPVREDVEFHLTERGHKHAEGCWQRRQQR